MDALAIMESGLEDDALSLISWMREWSPAATLMMVRAMMVRM